MRISAAAGPVGRASEASTELLMHAQILSYSRRRGLFAGITVNGSAIKEDGDANTRFYEQTLSSEAIVFERAGSSPITVGALKTALARPAPGVRIFATAPSQSRKTTPKRELLIFRAPL